MSGLLVAAEAGSSQTAETVVFWILAVTAVGAGMAMVAMRNIIHAALMLVLNFAAIAGMYLLLQTAFLSVVQIIVYAGAIVVLFLFVIMLLGVDRDDLLPQVSGLHRAGAVVLSVVVLAGVLWAVVGPFTSEASVCGPAQTVAQPGAEEPAGDPDTTGAAEPEGPSVDEVFARSLDDDVRCVGLDRALAEDDHGSVGFVANRLFNRHTFPFELAGLLLTVATIGAIVLGRRKDPESDATLLAQPEPAGVPGGSIQTPPAPGPGDTGDARRDEVAGGAERSEHARREDVGLGSGDAEAGRGAGPAAPGAADADGDGQARRDEERGDF